MLRHSRGPVHIVCTDLRTGVLQTPFANGHRLQAVGGGLNSGPTEPTSAFLDGRVPYFYERALIGIEAAYHISCRTV